MNQGLSSTLVALFATGCVFFDKMDSGDSFDSGEPVCEEPVEHPHDPTKPAWTYHGETDGEAMWGSLTGYELCDSGTEQSPIDVVTAETVAGESALNFLNYTVDVPLEMLNNGHTLQVNVAGTQSATDPQIEYGGTTYFLVQFHGHAGSEHTVDGSPSAMELHFVHQSAAGAYAVVGLMLDEGAENATIGTMLDFDPGAGWEQACEESLSLSVVPTGSDFFHYDGSLTTPDCREGVSWFVLEEHGLVAADQVADWEGRFGGTTNRPVQPMNNRQVIWYRRR